MVSGKCVLALSLGLGLWGLVGAQNHTLRSDHVVVNTQRHWNNWAFVGGILDISATGEVAPAFVPKDHNAVTDIVQHLQRIADNATILDAIEAGSNKAAVANLFDGDETTYWEPDPDSPLRDWWFQVDMGRLINATRVGLQFVPEGQGDPFLQFAVLTADNADQGNKIAGKVPMHLVYRTPSDNKNQRQFEFDLNRGELINPTPGVDFEGDMVRFVQVVITESDGARAVEVSAEEYEALASRDRGDVVFYKQVGEGEVEVEEAIYEAIDPQLRGPVRYYRRERPRLAELAVYALGKNISQGMILDRNGSAESSHDGSVGNLVDGEGTYLTFNLKAFQTGNVEFGERFLEFDLGASYWLDTVQIWYSVSVAGSRLAGASFHRYEIKTSDGTPAPGGGRLWTTPEQIRGLGTAYEVNTFKPTPARFMRIAYPFASSESGREGNKARPREVQIYGEGHHPEVELESGLIPLQGAKNLVSIEWEADTPPGTSVQIQTRTGNEVSEAYRYYDSGGTEVSEGKYAKLGFFKKGRIDTLQVAGSDWSNWSAPYARSGDPIVSPSPRQYLTLRARLTSTDPMQAASLHSIRLNFNPPVAKQLQGELDIGIFERLGAPQEVSLFVKPTFASQDLGFDEVLVRTPPDMSLEFGALRLGSTAQWESGQAEELADVQVMETRSDSLWLRLDRVVKRGGRVDLVEVRFTTALFSPGVVLQAALGNSSLANSWQQVDPADVTELAQSQGLQILASVQDNKVLGDLGVQPAVVTPNGDGVNDALTIGFTVRRLSGARPVKVRIYDLGGRLVRRLDTQKPLVAGEYVLDWAADDEQGQQVPPGIYILRIDIDADSDRDVRQTGVQRLLHVAY